MRLIIFSILLLPFCMHSQTREFYFGSNLSNYYWFGDNSSLNTNTYLPGAQIGFKLGKKEKGFFGNQKRLQLAFALEYSLVQIGETNELSSLLTFIEGRDIHSIRASAPFRFLFAKKARTNIFILGEPGANLIFYQNHDRTDGLDDRMNPIDLFIKGGIGLKTKFLKEKYEKSGYKFSGLTFTVSKYISIDPFRSNNAKIGILDQVLCDVGFRFSYIKVKKSFFN
jgi:hypothetical protein